jgi:cytochrome c oxidase cbb3-type subunit 3
MAQRRQSPGRIHLNRKDVSQPFQWRCMLIDDMYRLPHLYVCIVLLAALPLAAQEPPAGRGGRGGATRDFLGLGPAPDPVAAARGEKVYAANCAFCHGANARGAEGPNLLRSPLVLHDEKGELIAPALAKGWPDKGMPAFPNIAASQAQDIAQFLHLQVELVANRGTYKRLNVLTGDAKAGEAYFNGAGGCKTCHSTAGDLAHVGSKYPQPDQLQNRFVWPGGQPGPQKVTVTLPSGQTVSGTLKRIDDINVSLYDASGAFHSWPREGLKVEMEDRLAAHRQLLNKYTDADMHNLTAYLATLK